MVLNETNAWGSRWLRTLAEFVDDSWATLTTMRQRKCLREWSIRLILEYEDSLMRLVTDSVFVDEPCMWCV